MLFLFRIKIHRLWPLFLYTSSLFPNSERDEQTWKELYNFLTKKETAYDWSNSTMEYTRRGTNSALITFNSRRTAIIQSPRTPERARYTLWFILLVICAHQPAWELLCSKWDLKVIPWNRDAEQRQCHECINCGSAYRADIGADTQNRSIGSHIGKHALQKRVDQLCFRF